MNQLQVDLADMRAFGGKPYPFMLVAIDALTKKVAAEPLKDRLASTTAAGMKKVFQALGVPANVYSDDGAEFKREFKELMDFWDIEKQVTRGHAYFAERTIRTIKEAMLRRIAAGAGRRGQWHLMLADILSQINGRKHATTQVAPNLAYSDPEMAEIALRNIERRAKHKVTRPEIKVGDMVRIRVKPIESRGSYRVNEIAWSEKVYRVVSAESGEMGARFGLEGWPEKVVHRDLRKVPENSGGRDGELPGLLPGAVGARPHPLRHAARGRLGRHAAALGPRDAHSPHHRRAGLQGRAGLRHGRAELHLPALRSSQQPRAGRGGLQPRGARQLDLVLGLQRHVPGRNDAANAQRPLRGGRPARGQRGEAELAARDVPLEPELGVRHRGGELPAPRGLRLPPGAARPLGLGSPRA